MDLRKVKKLIELVEESAIEELEVANGEESVRIVMRRGGAPAVMTAAPAAGVVLAEPGAAVPAEPPAQMPIERGEVIAAPMAGTFYRAPHPEAPPFVEAGQTVEAGEVVCIIESMKMMHEIRATESATIARVCVENGAPIGTGDALFTLS